MVFRLLLDCEKLGKLEKMGKEVEDMEESQILDIASVEEILEETFNMQDVKEQDGSALSFSCVEAVNVFGVEESSELSLFSLSSSLPSWRLTFFFFDFKVLKIWMSFRQSQVNMILMLVCVVLLGLVVENNLREGEKKEDKSSSDAATDKVVLLLLVTAPLQINLSDTSFGKC
ncbi:hypothetical protein VNO78_11375 [Psophocarpus tetragonolobus]|uniref:Uncharacterized protein n=1 Tax=Psophocarpus tetragonolobus TaxID=3891 RepID=A0AAN9SLB9_PSOTE